MASNVITPPRRRHGKCANSGHAGEMLVAAELAMRGWIVGFAPAGNTKFDLFAYHPETSEHRLIQVKTGNSRPSFYWPVKPQPENHSSDHLFYVFVKLPRFMDERAFFWLAPSAYVHANIQQDAPKGHVAGEPNKGMHYFGPDKVRPAGDNWDILHGQPFQVEPAAELERFADRAARIAPG